MGQGEHTLSTITIIKDLEVAVTTKLANITYLFERTSSTLETKAQQSNSFLNSDATDALYSQGYKSFISNDYELNDHTAKRKTEKIRMIYLRVF